MNKSSRKHPLSEMFGPFSVLLRHPNHVTLLSVAPLKHLAILPIFQGPSKDNQMPSYRWI